MPKNLPMRGAADWDPGMGPSDSSKRMDELMATTAKDVPDAIIGTNEQKQWEGKSGKVPGPFGQKSKDF